MEPNFPKISYTAKDYASLREEVFQLAQKYLPQWNDRSPADPGVMLVELMAHFTDMMLYYQERIASESFLATASELQSVVNLLRLIGYELSPRRPARAIVRLSYLEGTKAELKKEERFFTDTTPQIPFVFIQGKDISSISLPEVSGKYEIIVVAPQIQSAKQDYWEDWISLAIKDFSSLEIYSISDLKTPITKIGHENELETKKENILAFTDSLRLKLFIHKSLKESYPKTFLVCYNAKKADDTNKKKDIEIKEKMITFQNPAQYRYRKIYIKPQEPDKLFFYGGTLEYPVKDIQNPNLPDYRDSPSSFHDNNLQINWERETTSFPRETDYYHNSFKGKLNNTIEFEISRKNLIEIVLKFSEGTPIPFSIEIYLCSNSLKLLFKILIEIGKNTTIQLKPINSFDFLFINAFYNITEFKRITFRTTTEIINGKNTEVTKPEDVGNVDKTSISKPEGNYIDFTKSNFMEEQFFSRTIEVYDGNIYFLPENSEVIKTGKPKEIIKKNLTWYLNNGSLDLSIENSTNFEILNEKQERIDLTKEIEVPKKSETNKEIEVYLPVLQQERKQKDLEKQLTESQENIYRFAPERGFFSDGLEINGHFVSHEIKLDPTTNEEIYRLKLPKDIIKNIVNSNKITLRYWTTLGSLGNVAENTITTSNLQGLKITNLKPAIGGKDLETPEEARNNAPKHLRTLKRAVTAKDFVTLAEQFPGVFCAEVEEHEFQNIVIYAMPENKEDLNPFALCKRLKQELNRYRMLTTHITVNPPNYITMTLFLPEKCSENEASKEIVRMRFEDQIENLSNRLKFREGKDLVTQLSLEIKKVEGLKPSLYFNLNTSTEKNTEDIFIKKIDFFLMEPEKLNKILELSFPQEKLSNIFPKKTPNPTTLLNKENFLSLTLPKILEASELIGIALRLNVE